MTTPVSDASPRTYAIGDVHGRVDLLRRTVIAIRDHVGSHPFRVVLLGDYVDRGPDSRGVIDLLIRLQSMWQVVCLKGNHEELMLEAVANSDGGSLVERWLEFGGRETLNSYQVREDENLAAALPRDHLTWMAALPTILEDRHRIYVHAGLMPGVPASHQNDAIRLWIRDRFLRGSASDFRAHIVHGHTPVWEGKPDAAAPELLRHRTNLDTGAFATGVLSVAMFDDRIAGGPVEVWKVRRDVVECHVVSACGPLAVDTAVEGGGGPAATSKGSRRSRALGGLSRLLHASDLTDQRRGQSREHT
jgi:serine/threonine protein phosphatase 1